MFLIVAVAVLIAVLATSKDKRYPKQVSDGARNAVQQAAQWSTTAEQDQHPLLRLTHANYAIAHVNALRAIMPDTDIERLTKTKPREMLVALKHQQSEAIRGIVRQAPQLAIQSQMGASAGWR